MTTAADAVESVLLSVEFVGGLVLIVSCVLFVALGAAWVKRAASQL